MLNNVVLDVFIGLVFIFLLYSHIATRQYFYNDLHWRIKLIFRLSCLGLI